MFGRELKKLISQIIDQKLKAASPSDTTYATWTGSGLKVDDKPIEIPKDMVNIPERLKEYDVKTSFELTEADLKSIAIIEAEDSMGGKVKFKHIKFTDVPMHIKYDKMEPGQRYLVQMKQGANRYTILDRIPKKE